MWLNQWQERVGIFWGQNCYFFVKIITLCYNFWKEKNNNDSTLLKMFSFRQKFYNLFQNKILDTPMISGWQTLCRYKERRSKPNLPKSNLKTLYFLPQKHNKLISTVRKFSFHYQEIDNTKKTPSANASLNTRICNDLKWPKIFNNTHDKVEKKFFCVWTFHYGNYDLYHKTEDLFQHWLIIYC